MRKRSFLWLSIVSTLMLIHVGIAQDKNQKPKRAVEKWAKEAKKPTDKQLHHAEARSFTKTYR
ncbi:TPA: hypothetical protein EYN98_25000 [Candidatus Poribacteria bacterium]|nr:hypothetical protein [Candidatus Poribacteria bacterium]